MKKNKFVRLDDETFKTIKSYKRELQYIENDDIALGDVIKRMAKGSDIPERLRMGALERRARKNAK
ncbi:hypothetical protein AYK24_09895 [Thermoplasmatales archaeon SG8-52-4]|nr:MAG: hypothetical protein AYK24_09895 [Thermoplasmatales archaeon SG8-52-4]